MDLTPLVEAEWRQREAHHLPPHHSVSQDDLFFKFTSPEIDDPGLSAFLAQDYEAAEKEWSDVSGHLLECVTFNKDLHESFPGHDFGDLPEVLVIREPPKGRCSYLACDWRYFAEFGAALVASIKGPVHVHLMDGDVDYAEKVLNQLESNAGLSFEAPQADAVYYHAVRFIRFWQFMRAHGPAILLDVDAIANRLPSELPDVPVGIRLRPARFEPWNQCNASVCVGQPCEYWDRVAGYIHHFWQQKKLHWQIDQAALFCVWKALGNDIHALGERDVDYAYDPESIIWCNSGENKWFKEDPDRQAYRDKFAEYKDKLPPAPNVVQFKKSKTQDLRDIIPKGRGRISFEEHVDRCRKGQAMGYPSLLRLKGKYRGGKCLIVGGGPSAEADLKKIRRMKKRGAVILAPNKSHDWLISKGIVPDYGVMIDPKPWVIDYQTPHPKVKYLLGSTLDPKAWEKFSKKQTYMWHPSGGVGEYEMLTEEFPYPAEWVCIPGPSLVGLRCLYIAILLGLDEIHLVGFDSSYTDGKLYAYDKPVVDKTDIHFTVADNLGNANNFVANHHMARGAYEFQDLVREWDKAIKQGQMAPVSIKVHGKGALPYLASVMGIHAEDNNLGFAADWGAEGTQALKDGDYVKAKKLFLNCTDALIKHRKAWDTTPPPRYEDIEKQEKAAHRIAYLPVEVKAREWSHKLKLGHTLKSLGFDVIIGPSWVLNEWAPALPPGVVLFKTLWGLDANNMTRWKHHLIAAMDEEAYGVDLSKRLVGHAHAVAQSDLICAQSEDHRDAVLAKFPEANVKVTGNPRAFAYWRDEPDRILVCAQSGSINSAGRTFAQMVSTTLRISGYPLTTPEGEDWARLQKEIVAHECDNLPIVRECIDRLNDAFDNVYVRRHPSEDPSLWPYRLDESESIQEALSKAHAVVYVSGCTTGYDAALAGVPAVRIGEGFGVSAGLFEHATPETIVDMVKAAKTETVVSHHDTLAETLSDLQTQFPMDGNYAFTDCPEINPNEFQRNKWPDTDIEAERLGWNTFRL